MNHLQLAFRNLKRRPARSILTVLGVALAVGSFITLYGLSRSVRENVQQSFEERGTDLTVRRRGIAEPFGGTMPQTLIQEIAENSRGRRRFRSDDEFCRNRQRRSCDRVRLGRRQFLLAGGAIA